MGCKSLKYAKLWPILDTSNGDSQESNENIGSIG